MIKKITVFKVALFIAATFFFSFNSQSTENFLDDLVQPKQSRQVVKEQGIDRCNTFGPRTCPIGYTNSHTCDETSQGSDIYEVTCIAENGSKRVMGSYTSIYETKVACDSKDVTHNGGCVPMVLVNEYDSCETVDTPVAYEPLTSDGNGYGCVHKSDGSRCLVDSDGFEVKEATVVDSQGNVDVYTKQACYPLDEAHDYPDNINFPPDFPAPIPPQNTPDVTDSEGCTPFGNQLVCAADPNEVCISGVCPSGCGSMDLGGGEEFVCFTKDTDSDGVPDLNDPDIDGDGIMNHNDPDADGDGIDDPLNDNTNTVNDLNQQLQNRLANFFLNQYPNGSGSGVGQGELLAVAESIDRNNEILLENLNGQLEANQIAKDSRDGIGAINANLNGIGSLITDAKNTNKESLQKISEQLDDLLGCTPTAENPCEGTGPSGNVDYTPSENAKSFYKSKYENGLTGIWEDKQAQLMQSPMFEFNNSMAQLQFAGTSPDLNFCFNLGAFGNFGCKELEIDSAVFDFIKLIMLVSAGFAAYYIVTIGR